MLKYSKIKIYHFKFFLISTGIKLTSCTKRKACISIPPSFSSFNSSPTSPQGLILNSTPNTISCILFLSLIIILNLDLKKML